MVLCTSLFSLLDIVEYIRRIIRITMMNMNGSSNNNNNKNDEKGNGLATWAIVLLGLMVLSWLGVMVYVAKSKLLADIEDGKLIGKTLTQEELEEQILEDQLKHLKDEHGRCRIWAEQGYCITITHQEYMSIECQRSCQRASICIPPPTTSSSNNNTSDDDDDDDAAVVVPPSTNQKQQQQQQKSSYDIIDLIHGVDFGVKQNLVERKLAEKEYRHININEVANAIIRQRQYLSKVVVNPDIKAQCRNVKSLCTIWAIGGACESNLEFMKNACAPACHSCHYLTIIEGRCPINHDPKVQALLPGDVDKLFTRLTTESLYQSKYNVEIISSPATKIKPTYYNEYDNSNAPWIITFDNVLTEEEAQTLIDIGTEQGYEASTEVVHDDQNADGSWEQEANKYRTSTNTWCSRTCESNTTVQTIIQRLSRITEIPAINSEFLQLLKYEEGQFYALHHDYIETEVKMQQGPRILTFFLYLNDVEEGGETYFDWLDLKVKPKMGRAVLWPSVLNDDPNARDDRTSHEASPVKAGIKYGANAWIHMRDYRTPYKIGCIHK